MSNVIRQQDLIDSIADALQFISYYHPLDFVQAMDRAYRKEANPAARDAIAQILINSRMCAQGHRPICQDTGIVTVFLEVGRDLRWEGDMDVTDMVNEGIRRAYLHPDNKLRASVLADPDGPPPLVLTHSALPPGAVFTPDPSIAGRGSFSWTPTSGAPRSTRCGWPTSRRRPRGGAQACATTSSPTSSTMPPDCSRTQGSRAMRWGGRSTGSLLGKHSGSG